MPHLPSAGRYDPCGSLRRPVECCSVPGLGHLESSLRHCVARVFQNPAQDYVGHTLVQCSGSRWEARQLLWDCRQERYRGHDDIVDTS